jgi:hypothetical protein
MSGVTGYLLSTSLVGCAAVVALTELGQQVAATFQTVADALRIAGAS